MKFLIHSIDKSYKNKMDVEAIERKEIIDIITDGF